MADPLVAAPEEVDPIAEQIAKEHREGTLNKPAPAEAPVEELDPLAVQIRQEKEQQTQLQGKLLDWRAKNETTDAGVRADVLRYSAASGLGPDFVEQNLEGVKRKVDAEKVDWNMVAYRQPKLVEFMLEQPRFTPVVKDDTANLGGVEWAIKAPFHAFLDAVKEQQTVGRQFAEAQGVGSEENRQRIAALEEQYGNKDYGAENFVSKGVIGTMKMLPFLAGDVASRALGGAAGAWIAGSSGAGAGAAAGAPVGGVGAAPGAGVGAVAGGLTGGAVGQFMGSGLFNYYEAVGPLYWKLSSLRDSNGEPLDPGVARAFAQSGAVVTAGLMAGFLGKVGGSLPGVKPLLAKFGANTVERALTEATTAQAMKSGAMRFGQHWLTGATMMAGQSAISATAEESAKSVSGQPFDVQWSNIGSAAKNGFETGLQDMWLLSALGPGREMIHDVGRARASAESAARLEAMTSSAKASKLLERFPEGFHQAVEKMKSADGAVENVYVPAEEWTRYWQDEKVDPGEVAKAVMGDDGKGYADAVATKGDLVIPVEKYLTNLAKTKHAEGLAPDAKLRADELTPRQFTEEQKQLGERMKEQAKVRGTEIDAGKKEVGDFIREQATAAGISRVEAEANAKLVSEYAGTLALRMGVSVQEAAAAGALGRLRILGPRGEAVAAAARERFQRFLNPDASKQLAERLTTMGPEARARELFVDQNTGLLNEKAFTELKSAGKVGHIAVEGIKYLNDSVSHDRADLLYRAVAKVLHEVDPNAAKVGGDFAIHVADQAALDAVVAKVKAALPEQLRGFDITGQVGDTLKAAGEANRGVIDAAVAKGERAHPRRPNPNDSKPFPAEKPKGLGSLEAKDITFPADKASAVVPEDLANRIGGLSSEDYFKEAYVEPATGLLTAKGWDAIPRKAHVAAIDLRGLRDINNRFGEAAGDEVLQQFGSMASHFGGSSFDFAHLHGDEYAAQHSDPAELERFLTRVREVVKDATTEAKVDGEEVEIEGIEFRQGIGKGTYESADRALNDAKRLEQATAKGEAVGAGSERQNRSDGAEDRGHSDLAGGGKALGRGAQPQGFPSDREAGHQVVTHLEGSPVTFKPGTGEARGSINLQLDPGGHPLAFDINVLSKDRSTLLHETAHFLSWSLHDLAHSDLATHEIKTDYGKLIEWAGYSSAAERLAQTKEHAELARKADPTHADKARLKELSAKEERISHGWEQYLQEGKAPSEGLARVFSRFRDWLGRIYKGVAGIQGQYREQFGQEINLSPEVRGVFNRMLAENQALADARVATGSTPPPLITSAMTPAERILYRQALADARVGAEKELAQRTAELESNQVSEARARFTTEEAQKLDTQSVYRAMRYLQHGELVDAQGKPATTIPEPLLDKEGKPYKLSRKAFVDTFGADAARLVPSDLFDRYKKRGVSADELAPLLGFDSGEQFAEALAKAEPRDAAIERQTQARMDAAYGPALQHIADAAMAAVHNDAAARATLIELRALAKQVSPEVAARAKSINLKTLKDSAERLVNESTVDSLDPTRFARNERKAALSAAKLWGQGDKEKAVEQREARLFNQLLYSAARDSLESVTKLHDKLERTSDDVRANLGKADPAYRDVHDSLLAAVGMGEKPANPRSLDQLLQLADSNGQTIAFDVEAIRQLIASPKDWGSLTVDEAQGVGDAVKNLRHLARATLELELAGKKQTKEAWLAEFQKTVAQRKPLKAATMDPAAQTTWDKIKHLGRGADALFTDVAETYSHMLDVGDRAGPVNRLLVDARLEAREKASTLSNGVLKPIMEKWEKVPKEIRHLVGKSVDVAKLLPVPPGSEARFAPVYTRSSLYMLFLNWGNEGNRQRIRDGNGWSDDNVNKALSLLTKPELTFLQGVLDTINSLYPDVAAVHEKRTGLPLGKVESSAITVNGEEYAGGYFPLKADPRFNTKAAHLQAYNDVKSLFGPTYAVASTPASFRKARAEKAAYPVDLQWGVVPAHLSQVIHDIAYGDWVRQAGSVLTEARFKDTTAAYIGQERSSEFLPWLRDVANAKADSGSQGMARMAEQIGGFARNRAAVAVMGYNLPAIAGQILDPWNARQEDVGARHIAAAYVKVNSFVAKAIDLPELKLSKEIANRDANFKSNLRRDLAKVGPGGSGLAHGVAETAFALYDWSDWYTSRVTFKAAYDAALSDGATEADAAKRGDDVVRKAYASHDIAEKPPIMRSKKGAAALVMFYGFANRLYNSQRRAFDSLEVALGEGADAARAAGRKTPTEAIANVAGKLMFLGGAGAAFAYIAGRGPKKDEDAKKWLAWRIAMEPLGTVPFLGGAVEGLVKGGLVNSKTEPGVALLQDTLHNLGVSVNGLNKASTEHDDNKILTNVELLLGSLGQLYTPLPINALQRTGGYGQQLATGAARPRTPWDIASGFFYGQRKNTKDQPRNPITDLGAALH